MTTVGGMDLIRQSIATILDTEPGERIMLPSFGCGLRRYLMEPNTLATRTGDGGGHHRRRCGCGSRGSGSSTLP